MFGKRMERDVRTFKLLRARIPMHLVPIRSAYLDSLFGTQKFLLKEAVEFDLEELQAIDLPRG